MLTITIFITAIGLAMDAVAVAIASGLAERRLRFSDALKMALVFGVFQALMPLAGFLLGDYLASWSNQSLAAWIHASSAWIVFAVLVLIGVNMIREASTKDVGTMGTSESARSDRPVPSPFNAKRLIALAFATSIDALAVGMSFSLINTDLFFTCSTIGVVTFLLCLPAAWYGAKLGARLATRAEIFGGLILIAIGCKILLAQFF